MERDLKRRNQKMSTRSKSRFKLKSESKCLEN